VELGNSDPGITHHEGTFRPVMCAAISEIRADDRRRMGGDSLSR
jgi:hypothetical protein